MRIAEVGTVVMLGLMGFLSSARADEVKIPLKDVPKAVVDAVKSRFPNAQMMEVAKEAAEGKTTYEVALKVQGKAIDVALTAEGKITEIEREVTDKDLPIAVASAVAAKYPKATVTEAEEIVAFKGDKATRSFEILLTLEARKSIEVKLSPEGKILEEEESNEN